MSRFFYIVYKKTNAKCNVLDNSIKKEAETKFGNADPVSV